MARGKREFKADYEATGGLMMQMTKSLFVTGKALVMDSGFCVLKGLVGMFAYGVYGTTLIKKKRYWPRYCKGDAIEAFFEDQQFGYVYSVCGDMDGHKYKIQCMKEAYYAM